MALDAAKIQAILFDIDGTLSDTDDQMMKQAEKILSPLRLFFNAEETDSHRTLAGDGCGITGKFHL